VLHAYARLYGRAGRQSTRVKDLVDLVLLQRSLTFSARRLRAALATAFGGAPPPAAVPPPPRDWATRAAQPRGGRGARRRPGATGPPLTRDWRGRSPATRPSRQRMLWRHGSSTRSSTARPGTTIGGTRRRGIGSARWLR